MIRLVEGAPPPMPACEAAVRIECLHRAYAGTGVVRCWEDEQGSVLCLMDGHAVFYTAALSPEWVLFIAMQPEILSVRTDAPTAQALYDALGGEVSCGEVMQAPQGIAGGAVETAAPREIYPVLQAGFGASAPAFEPWYVDVMLRQRRGLCRIACVRETEAAVATAMTVAEGEETALIGAVATHPDFRRRGYAGACVSALAAQLQAEGRQVLLSPKNEAAARVYAKLGFTVCGTWGEFSKK
jgi:GNAT superfamily N-acetyltransferase